MKKTGFLVTALLILVLALSGCGKETKLTPEQVQAQEKVAIEKMANEYEATVLKVDYKTWTGNEMLPFYIPGEPQDQIKAALPKLVQFYQENQIVKKMDTLTMKKIEFISEGNTAAYVNYETVASGTSKGQSVINKSNVALELEKTDGKWLIKKRVSKTIQ